MLRSRINWLAAALVAGVVISFVIPLCLLIRTMAEDRAVSMARSDAQGIAMIVAGVDDPAALPTVLSPSLGTRALTTVWLPAGQVLGSGDRVDFPEDARLVTGTRLASRSMTTTVDGRFHVLIPVGVHEQVAVVHSVADLDQVRRGVYVSWTILAGLGLALVVLSVLVARHQSRRISTPVVAMADVAHRLRSGDFDARAEVTGPVEVVELGQALNQLADRIEDLLRVEREGAADLSHRLRTPVTALRLDTDQVEDPVIRARLRGHVEGLHRAIDSIVADARRPSREVMGGRCEARTVLAERAHHWRPLAEDQGRQLTVTGTDPALGAAWVALSGQDCADLLDNLVDNVFAHTPEGSPIHLAARTGPGLVELRVEDAGPADPDTLAPARGESGGGGTGLGLDIVRRLAADAGGSVSFDRSGLGGLAVVVRLPLLPQD